MSSLTKIRGEGVMKRFACLMGATHGSELIELKPGMDLREHTMDVEVDLTDLEPIVNYEFKHIIPHLDYLQRFGCKIKDTPINVQIVSDLAKVCAEERLVIAGGYATGRICSWIEYHPDVPANDIDIYPPTGADIPRIIKKLARVLDWQYIVRSEYSVTFYQTSAPIVQLVLATYESVSQLLTLFDIPAVSCGLVPVMDGPSPARTYALADIILRDVKPEPRVTWRAFATKEALWQIYARTIIFDRARSSFNYMERLRKYYKKGFCVWFPNYAGEDGNGEIAKFHSNNRTAMNAYGTEHTSCNIDKHALDVVERNIFAILKGQWCKVACIKRSYGYQELIDDTMEVFMMGRLGEKFVTSIADQVMRYVKHNYNKHFTDGVPPNATAIIKALALHVSPPLDPIPISALIQDSINKTPMDVLWYGRPREWKLAYTDGVIFPYELQASIDGLIIDGELHPIYVVAEATDRNQKSVQSDMLYYYNTAIRLRYNHMWYGNFYCTVSDMYDYCSKTISKFQITTPAGRPWRIPHVCTVTFSDDSTLVLDEVTH